MAKNTNEMECAKAIIKAKNKLIAQAAREGQIRENFGRKEVRKLEDSFCCYAGNIGRMIMEFGNWCEDYTGR